MTHNTTRWDMFNLAQQAFDESVENLSTVKSSRAFSDAPSPRATLSNHWGATMDGDDALNRLKGMVVEVPGTEWTVTDAAKLSGLEPAVCRTILETLERDGLLMRRADGVFVRGLTRARSPVLGGDQMDPVTPVEPGELLLQRIRREYREMPALRLSLRQAQRLWGVDAATRDAAIRRLLDERFLCCTPGGTYAREKRRWPRPAPIKATLASGRSPRRQGRQP